MKKINSLVLALATVCLLSCGGSKTLTLEQMKKMTPSEVFLLYSDSYTLDKMERGIQLTYISEDMVEVVKENGLVEGLDEMTSAEAKQAVRDYMVKMTRENFNQEAYDELLSLREGTSFKVLEESIDEDGKSAVLKAQLTHADKSVESDFIMMAFDEAGGWRVVAF